jgi:hypothetical protein
VFYRSHLARERAIEERLLREEEEEEEGNESLHRLAQPLRRANRRQP